MVKILMLVLNLTIVIILKAASSSKKRQHTPESAMNKRGIGRSPVAVSSPSSQTSPAV